MKQAAGVARAILGTALVAGMLLGGCEGNVNDDSVTILPIDVASRTASGALPTGRSYGPSISLDGRFAVFTAKSSGMHPLDTNAFTDVFLRDMEAGTTRLISINATGIGAGNGNSKNARISPDGQFVAFWSQASNLVPVPDFVDDGQPDIYVHCLRYGTTLPVSVINVQGTPRALGLEWMEGGCLPDVVADEKNVYVVYETSRLIIEPDAKSQIYLRIFSRDDFDNPTLQKIGSGKTFLVSTAESGAAANGHCRNPVIALGTWPGTTDIPCIFVAWDSYANNLTPDNTGNRRNVFMYVLERDKPESVLMRYMLSKSAIDNNDPDGDSYVPLLSADGNYVTFTSTSSKLLATQDDYNGAADVFRYGPIKGISGMTRVSEGPNGLANSASFAAGISADGRYVLFSSAASNLVENDLNDSTDVFLKDMDTGDVTRVSLTMFGGEPAGESGSINEVNYDWDQFKPCGGADLSGDGKTAVFHSRASNILPGIVIFDGMHVYRRKF